MYDGTVMLFFLSLSLETKIMEVLSVGYAVEKLLFGKDYINLPSPLS